MKLDSNDNLNYEETKSEKSKENKEKFQRKFVDRKVKQILKILQPLQISAKDLNSILKRVIDYLEQNNSFFICKKMIFNLKTVLSTCALKEH